MPFVLLCISLLSCFASVLLLAYSLQTQPTAIFSTGESSVSALPVQKTINVDISGGIQHPGVYKMNEGARIEDAINLAGGLRKDADKELIAKSINRAKRLQDGIKIYIPIQNDDENIDPGERIGGFNTSHNIEEIEQGNALISINTASKDVLDTLPGVGPATADKIVAERPYLNLEELLTKKVVGKNVYEKIIERIAL